MDIEPPPILTGPREPDGQVPPPIIAEPGAYSGQATPPPKEARKVKGPLGAVLAALAAGWKFILPALKLLKGGKFLLTGATMLLSIGVYSIRFGWKFALGFVLCIFVHEMGHVLMAKKQGVPVTAPIFIPFFGALILQKKWASTAWGEALIGIGGPIGGGISAFVCWGLYFATGAPIFLALAYFAFFINLFNLTPIFPLDGGWIVGAISPYLWIGGLVIFAGLAITRIVTSPLIWILIIMSLPHVWSALKAGKAYPGALETTPRQKLLMGGSYLALCGILVGGMVFTENQLHTIMPRNIQSNQGAQAQ
jgi:Zn-dependent protease